MNVPQSETSVQAAVTGGTATFTTIIFQNGQQRTVDVFRLLGPIEETRRQAEDWKMLHEDFQRISLQLVFVHATSTDADLKVVLKGLEFQWMLQCGKQIRAFLKLEKLPERAVRQEFTTANEESKWLTNIKLYTSKLDGMIGECKEVEDLRWRLRDIVATLQLLEIVSGDLLSFLDSRLQRVIKDLDQAIAQAKWSLTQPIHSNEPKALS